MGGRGASSTTQEIPQELRPLMSNTASHMLMNQNSMQLNPFFTDRPQQVAGLTPQEGQNINWLQGYGAQTGANPYEQGGMQYGAGAVNSAFNNGASLQNYGDAYGLSALRNTPNVSSYNMGDRYGLETLAGRPDVSLQNLADQRGQQMTMQMLGLANTNLAAPGTDQNLLRSLSQANYLAGQRTGGMTAQELAAQGYLGNLGGLSATNPADYNPYELGAVRNYQNLFNQSGQSFDDLSLYEREALGQLGQLGAQNQQSLQTTYAPEQEALDTLRQFTQGDLFQSPATQAAMKAFSEQAVPQIESRLALRGMENSGAAAEAFAQAQTQALVPLLQQELQQRQAAVPMLAALAEAQSARERGDQARQLQAGLQIAGQTSEAGARASDRQREDLTRAVTLGSQLSGQMAGIGGLAAARERADLDRMLAAQSGLAGQYANLGNTLATRDMAGQAQQFGQYGQLGQQYQNVSQMLADRDRQDLLRQIGAYESGANQLYGLGQNQAMREQANQQAALQEAAQLFGYGQNIAGREGMNQNTALQQANQLFGYGQNIAGREISNQSAQIGAQQQQAQLLSNLGNVVENRDFQQMLDALQTASLPRDIQNQQYEAQQLERARRQGLAEQMLLAPIGAGLLTSGIGQTVNSRQSGLLPGYKG